MSKDTIPAIRRAIAASTSPPEIEADTPFELRALAEMLDSPLTQYAKAAIARAADILERLLPIEERAKCAAYGSDPDHKPSFTGRLLAKWILNG